VSVSTNQDLCSAETISLETHDQQIRLEGTSLVIDASREFYTKTSLRHAAHLPSVYKVDNFEVLVCGDQ